jgi:HSP20 family protein
VSVFIKIEKGKKTMSTLVKWNPFGELDELQNRFDSLFFNGFPNRMRFLRRFENGEELRLPNWSPLVDITEDDHEYLFKADLPEMKKEDVKVTVEKGILFIAGERKIEKEEKKTKFHRIERAYGRFERTFALPDDADPAKIVADFKDGLLKVHLPKLPMAKVKPIEVKVQ